MTGSRYVRLLRTLKRDPITLLALAWLATLAVVIVAPGVIPSYDPFGQNLNERFLRPLSTDESGSIHLLGTDSLGRDYLSRLAVGARWAMGTSVASVLIAGTVGSALGLVAGYFGKWTDEVIMRIADLQISFPGLLVALFVLLALGPVGVTSLILVMAVIRWPLYARLVRATTLSLKEREFVMGARILGASNLRILRRHIVPNLMSQILILGTLELARMMMLEASLSYLGMGLQPPSISWGLLVSSSQSYIRTASYLVTFAGLMIFLTALSLNLVASWANSVFSPGQRWRWE
jgi:peptide/nickel transport system permease protein